MSADTRLKPGWRIYRFDEIAINVNERVDDPSKAGVEYYVGLEHLDADSLTIRRWGSPSDVQATKLLFKKGDIIFGRRRVYQRKVAVAPFHGICSAHAMVLRARPDAVLPEFLPFFMQTDAFMERAKAISVGSLSPTINWSALAREEFLLPPLDEQRRIADALKGMEALCETQRAVALASARLHAAQLAWLEQSDTTERVRLEALLSAIVPGKSVAGANAPPAHGQYGVLKVSAVDPQGFAPFESKRLLREEDFVSEFSVKSGDIIMTRANTPELVGEVCLVDRDYPTLMLCDKTLRLEPKKSIDRYLLWEMLQTDSVRRQLMALATGTGRSMKNISQEKIRGLVVAYPNDAGAPEVAKRLRLSRGAIEQARGRQHEADQVRQTMRAALLAGNGIV
jgi:restriction endonuclease S subunit